MIISFYAKLSFYCTTFILQFRIDTSFLSVFLNTWLSVLSGVAEHCAFASTDISDDDDDDVNDDHDDDESFLQYDVHSHLCPYITAHILNQRQCNRVNDSLAIK